MICVTETWLNDNFVDSEICDKCYSVFRKGRESSKCNKFRGDGVLVAVKHKYHPTQIQYNTGDQFDWVWVKSIVKDLKVMSFCVYVPPV